jgi:hypothetical protein
MRIWESYEGLIVPAITAYLAPAITAYLAATKATAPDPAPMSRWREALEAIRDNTTGYPHCIASAAIGNSPEIPDSSLSAAPEPPVSADFPREHVTRKFICDGCPDLKTKEWTFEGENDDYDSGTSAFCGDRSISGYWRENQAVPKWCPRLPAPPKGREGK